MTVKVRFTNDRAKVVRYNSGEPIIGVNYQAGTKRVVATCAGPIAVVGRTGTLRKGKQGTVEALVTTDPPPRRTPQGTIVTPRPHPALP